MTYEYMRKLCDHLLSTRRSIVALKLLCYTCMYVLNGVITF